MRWDRVLFLLFRVILFFPVKIPLILLLLLFGRGSLALHLWGRGWLNKKIAYLYDADPGMYKRRRWKETRKPVYWRNKRANKGVFRCEITGFKSSNLKQFHVDHRLSRAGFPMLAYEQWNLQLVRDRVNIKKSDKLSIGCFIRFAIFKRI